MTLFLFLAVLGQSEPSADEIVDRAVARNAFGFENSVAKVALSLRGKSGEKQRTIEIRSKRQGTLGRTLVRFHSPADVAGTGFLVVEQASGDDEQYLYLPALGKVKRITGNQKHQKFMGTDLTYSDLEWHDLKQANLERLADTTVGQNPTYVVVARPKPDSDSPYGKTVTYVHKDSFVPLKVEFFDKAQQLLKVLTVRRLEKRDGRFVVTETHVKDVQAGSETMMTVTELTPKSLDAAEFTERALVSG
jgi:hypothetical protein